MTRAYLILLVARFCFIDGQLTNVGPSVFRESEKVWNFKNPTTDKWMNGVCK